MSYDVVWAIARSRQPKTNYTYFWGHKARKDGRMTTTCFSQWFPSPFKHERQKYLTAEHWMMAEKARLFGDERTLAKILDADNPSKAKALGRTVHGFDSNAWDAAKLDIVIRGNTLKFRTHKNMATVLRKTGTAILVEASPVNPVWGIGLAATDPRASDPKEWKGQNLLGFALMHVRDQLEAMQ